MSFVRHAMLYNNVKKGCPIVPFKLEDIFSDHSITAKYYTPITLYFTNIHITFLQQILSER